MKLWAQDFQNLLNEGRKPFEIQAVINLSQSPGQKKYYVRSKAILEKFDFLLGAAKKILSKGKVDFDSVPPGSGTPPALEYNKSKYAPSPEKVASRQRAMLEAAAELEEL
jgi:hypothetical protein